MKGFIWNEELNVGALQVDSMQQLYICKCALHNDPSSTCFAHTQLAWCNARTSAYRQQKTNATVMILIVQAKQTY